jgi:hypothetical protein
MRSGWFLVTLSLLFITCLVHGAKPHGKMVDEQRFKDYTVRIYRYPNIGGCFEILKSGKQVFFEEGEFFAVGDVTPASGQTVTNAIKMGQSITSEKRPNLLVTGWTSGNHCCNSFYVFEIGDKFKLIGRIEAEYFEISEFKDLRGDGNLELVTADFTFAYWNVGSYQSHSPTIILRYQDGRYVPDLEKMRKPAPTEDELKRMAKEFKAKFDDLGVVMPFPAPPEMWQEMLNLIYTGNMNTAWRLLDMSWPAERPGKMEFLRQFKKELSTSPYYRDIQRFKIR